MVTRREADVPEAFAVIAKAIYGEAVDIRELWDLRKSMDASEVHVDKEGGKPKKALAAGLVAGSAAEGLATVRSVQAARAALKTPKAKAITGAKWPKEPGLKGKLAPLRRAAGGPEGKAAEAAFQGANFLIGLTAARELAKKPKPEEKVAKAFRMKALNPGAARKVVSLKARKPASFTAIGKISKLDEDQHLVFGWANVSELNGVEVEDLQGDIVPVEELEKSAYDYVLDSRIGGDMHDRVHKGLTTEWTAPRHTADLVESMVFTDDKIAALGLPEDFPRGWWVGFKVRDEEQWALVKGGERAGFSIHGTGRREPVEKKFLTLDEARQAAREHRERLHRRADAALHPPAVRREEPKRHSSALKSLGYQRQTRRMAVEMRSRPGRPYTYKATPEQFAAQRDAESQGHHYATEVRGKLPRKEKVTLADRARLFADPDVSKALAQLADTGADVLVAAQRAKGGMQGGQPKMRKATMRPVVMATGLDFAAQKLRTAANSTGTRQPLGLPVNQP